MNIFFISNGKLSGQKISKIKNGRYQIMVDIVCRTQSFLSSCYKWHYYIGVYKKTEERTLQFT